MSRQHRRLGLGGGNSSEPHWMPRGGRPPQRYWTPLDDVRSARALYKGFVDIPSLQPLFAGTHCTSKWFVNAATSITVAPMKGVLVQRALCGVSYALTCASKLAASLTQTCLLLQRSSSLAVLDQHG
jgi:hypothetical protein